jgi:TonB family protein
MNDLLIYLLKVSVGLGIIFMPYYFLFRNDPNLGLKRFYLLSGVLAAWIFPFITFRKLPLTVDLTPTVFIDLDAPPVQTAVFESSGSAAGWTINWLQVLIILYLAGILILFLKNLFLIVKWNLTWRRSHNEKGVAFIKNDQVFTLFTKIFVPGSLRNDSDLDAVLLHEKAHIQQLHFIDLMIIECTLLLTWFNPFSWLISRMIKENHEHLADRQVLSAGINPARYRAQLMNHTLGVNVFRLSNQFNHSLTLKRFKMMKKPTKSLWGMLKIALLIPAVLVTLGLTTGMTPQQKTIKGKVVLADTGEPVPGASIVIRNGTTGCVSDVDGTFMLNVDGDPELVVSFVGYETLIVKASDAGKKPLELEVKTYDLDLESVPLEMKQEVTGSISIKLDKDAEAQPVFILDGEKVTDGIDDLDPGQIASVEVLKDPDDPLVKKYKAKDGVIVITTKAGNLPQENLSREEFYVVEEMPTFNGGNAGDEFRKYIAQNLRYPKSAADKGIQGKVIVQFAVNKNGQVVDPKVVRGVDPDLDKEALRVVNSSPRWTPGKHEGKPVVVLFIFPFNFVLEDSGTDKAITGISVRKTDGSEAHPVYVVDGVEVEGIETLNSDLIEKIEVIKDPDHPLMEKYNARDGVVLITTKEAAAAQNKDSESPEKDGEPFYVVEEMPKFPGGLSALKTYIYSNLEYPAYAKSQGIEGEVYVRFLINAKGRAVNGEILRSTYQGFDAPALKVIEEMPAWTPGRQRGKPVQVWYVMSIKFSDDKI